MQTSFSPYNSDHVPFVEAGIPAVLTIEGADGANDFIHTSADTLEKIDISLAMEILKMNTGFVAMQLGKSETRQARNAFTRQHRKGNTMGPKRMSLHDRNREYWSAERLAACQPKPMQPSLLKGHVLQSGFKAVSSRVQ